MEPRHSAQDIVRCDLCDTPVPPLYCDFCHIYLCKTCVGEHISDTSMDHKVVPFEKRESTTKCINHSTKICELHCQQCNIPICALCVSSKEHKTHDVVDILHCLTTKKELIKRDLHEIEKSIYPKYQRLASNIIGQRKNLSKNSEELKAALIKQKEAFHREIDVIIHNLQAKVDDIELKQITAIDKQAEEINSKITELEQNISDMRKFLASENVNFVSSYKSKNEEFRRIPNELQILLPNFIPREINSENLHQQFGAVSTFTPCEIITEHTSQLFGSLSDLTDYLGSMMSPVPMTFLETKQLIDEPLIITNISSTEEDVAELRSVSCLNDNDLWICRKDKIIKLKNLQGELLNSVFTETGNEPWDIAVTDSGRLLYSDSNDRSVNIVENSQVQSLIRLQEWMPLNICCSSSGDLLVIMISNDHGQTKLVRFSGSTEKQNIQWDHKAKPLYSAGSIKYLSENRNLDICVADFDACAVVVVSAAGKLRFRYTGRASANKGLFSKLRLPSTNKESFHPYGIATDSQGKILTADNHRRIHILDQEGHFLRYIDNCDLRGPYGICVDSKDNLLVTDEYNVKKIQYYK